MVLDKSSPVNFVIQVELLNIMDTSADNLIINFSAAGFGPDLIFT